MEKNNTSLDSDQINSDAVNQLSEALTKIKLKVIKFDPSKQRPVGTSEGTKSLEKFSLLVTAKLGREGVKYPEVFKALHDLHEMDELLKEYANINGILVKGRESAEIPEIMQGLDLNFDVVTENKDKRFFLTDKDGFKSRISGDAYLLALKLSHSEAVSVARAVMPEYIPHGPAGAFERELQDRTEVIYNTYVPPAWVNYKDWDKLPDKLPLLFKKLVNHLFPIEIEREYFFSWLHQSLFDRAFVYLILCGAPGVGKNRLKLIMRALHGDLNTTDGKKSTLNEKFNSQLLGSTLCWFDELHYTSEMENVMKEIQNDTISIERKGVDATRASRIHASLVISNNKPRDNYIGFDARKFVPLMLTTQRLEKSLSAEEITKFTEKVEDPTSPNFDVKFIAQIAKWVKKHGKSSKWPNLEYLGPMFWTLAHTSMSRWQKRSAVMVLEAQAQNRGRFNYDKDKGFQWSSLLGYTQRRSTDRYVTFPDYSSVQHFFDTFKDSKGDKAFITEAIDNDLMGDFWVKSIAKNISIKTEDQTDAILEGGDENDKIQL